LIHIGIDPDIATFGSFSIGWHGILMFIGIIVGVLLTLHLARRAGFTDDIIYTSSICAVIFGLIGARITHILDHLDYYSDNPGKIIALQEGGLGWYGGLIGGVLAVVVYSRIRKFSLGRFADAAAPGIMLGLSIGRIGCTINGDSVGTPTSLPWGFIYTNPDSFAPLGVATHPAPVYEIIWNMALFGVLWRLKDRIKPDGSLFLVMIAVYSFGRFFISFVRDEVPVLGPLHESHIISIALFVIAVALLAYRKVRLMKPEPPEVKPQETQP
jgi:phosphatidylglycerol:prolipoprotein diacylglycerol transferase